MIHTGLRYQYEEGLQKRPIWDANAAKERKEKPKKMGLHIDKKSNIILKNKPQLGCKGLSIIWEIFFNGNVSNYTYGIACKNTFKSYTPPKPLSPQITI